MLTYRHVSHPGLTFRFARGARPEVLSSFEITPEDIESRMVRSQVLRDGQWLDFVTVRGQEDLDGFVRILAKDEPKPAKDAQTKTTTYNDGKFVRTALVIGGEDNQGSVDVVDASGRRLAQINLFWTGEGQHLIVDVIDVDKRFDVRRALAFSQTERKAMDVPEGGDLVSVDFMDTKAEE